MTASDDKRHMDGAQMIYYIHPHHSYHIHSIPPTWTTLLDSMIELYLDPTSTSGRMHIRQDEMFLNFLFSYSHFAENSLVAISNVELVRSLKPENQPYFDNYARLELARGSYDFLVTNLYIQFY